jgi:hypothetical protein
LHKFAPDDWRHAIIRAFFNRPMQIITIPVLGSMSLKDMGIATKIKHKVEYKTNKAHRILLTMALILFTLL